MSNALDVVSSAIDVVMHTVPGELPDLDRFIDPDVYVHGPWPVSIRGKDNVAAAMQSVRRMAVEVFEPAPSTAKAPAEFMQVTHVFGDGDWVAVRMVTLIGQERMRKQWLPGGWLPSLFPGATVDENPQAEGAILFRVHGELIDEVWIVAGGSQIRGSRGHMTEE